MQQLADLTRARRKEQRTSAVLSSLARYFNVPFDDDADVIAHLNTSRVISKHFTVITAAKGLPGVEFLPDDYVQFEALLFDALLYKLYYRKTAALFSSFYN